MTTIKAQGDYARLSRGRHCAKHLSSGTWAERDGEWLLLDKPGRWMLSTTDGFSRKDTIYVDIKEDTAADDLSSRRWEFSD